MPSVCLMYLQREGGISINCPILDMQLDVVGLSYLMHSHHSRTPGCGFCGSGLLLLLIAAVVENLMANFQVRSFCLKMALGCCFC